MIFWSFDPGYNALVLFFVFWILLIMTGVVLKLKNLGINRENYGHRIQDLWHEYLERLQGPPHRDHR